MRSVRHKLFNKAFEALPSSLQTQARLAFAKWQTNPQQVGWKRLPGMKSPLFSAQIGYGARAIALVTRDARGEPLACWIWAGTHETYNHFIDIQRQRSEQTFTQGLTAAQRGATLSDRVHAVQEAGMTTPSTPTRLDAPCRRPVIP